MMMTFLEYVEQSVSKVFIVLLMVPAVYQMQVVAADFY